VVCTSAGASVMHERALETREPSCVPRATKLFFILVVHSQPRAVGHVVAPELPSWEGRAPSCGTCGSIGAPLSGRQSPEPWDTWQHQSSPLRKAKPPAMGHVAALKLPSQEGRAPISGTCGSTGVSLSGTQSLEPWDTWQ
jgi:hypothetical protein